MPIVLDYVTVCTSHNFTSVHTAFNGSKKGIGTYSGCFKKKKYICHDFRVLNILDTSLNNYIKNLKGLIEIEGEWLSF